MIFNWYGQQFKLNVKYAIHNTLNEIGTQGIAEIKQSFPEGSFRKWRSKRSGTKWHWSSKPGQPPSVDTAKLMNSIRYDMEREIDGERLRISANTEYARAQELGYAPKGLAPRPYLQPQLEIIRTKAMVILQRKVSQVIK